jgi:Domain of unknown function (DUF6924)
MGLPQPDDLTSLVLRTDFSDDRAWEVVQMTITASSEYPSATYVSDPAYAGVHIQDLVDADSIADDDEKIFHVFLADEITMADAEHPLLAVDLASEPGRTFRVLPRCYIDISANLCVANLDFADFADAVDSSGTYRGLGGDRC